MRTLSVRAALGIAVLGLSACASNPAPRGTLRPAQAMQNTAYGGYILIRQSNGAETRGELLAVHDGKVHVQTPRHVQAVPVIEIRTMTLAAYLTGESELTGWGVVGTLSTLSHGFFLVVSAPIWLLGTGISAGVESRAALIEYPDKPLDAFIQFARYPQGPPRPPAAPPAPVPAPDAGD